MQEENCLRAVYTNSGFPRLPGLTTWIRPASFSPPSILQLLPNKPANPRVLFSLTSNRNSFFSLDPPCILAGEEIVASSAGGLGPFA